MSSRLHLILIAILISFSTARAEDFTIGTAGNSFSPSTLTVNIGDEVTIMASTMHPTTQVDDNTWETGGTTPLEGGWGTRTSEFTITINSLQAIYFVCNNHVAQGMKGRIIVSNPTNTQEAINKIGFQIYPNPSGGDLLQYRISREGFTTGYIALFDLEGRQVQEGVITGKYGEIKTNLSAGHYIYIVRDESGSVGASGKITITY